jgi:hypothetical protein
MPTTHTQTTALQLAIKDYVREMQNPEISPVAEAKLHTTQVALAVRISALETTLDLYADDMHLAPNWQELMTLSRGMDICTRNVIECVVANVAAESSSWPCTVNWFLYRALRSYIKAGA